MVGWLVGWYFEPSQPQRITSQLKIMFNLSPIYAARRSSNHKLSKNTRHKTIHNIKQKNRRISPFGITRVKKAHKARTWMNEKIFTFGICNVNVNNLISWLRRWDPGVFFFFNIIYCLTKWVQTRCCVKVEVTWRYRPGGKLPYSFTLLRERELQNLFCFCDSLLLCPLYVACYYLPLSPRSWELRTQKLKSHCWEQRAWRFSL